MYHSTEALEGFGLSIPPVPGDLQISNALQNACIKKYRLQLVARPFVSFLPNEVCELQLVLQLMVSEPTVGASNTYMTFGKRNNKGKQRTTNR